MTRRPFALHPVALACATLLLLLQAPQPAEAGKPSVPVTPCNEGQDLTGLTAVNVTAGKGQIKLLASASEACDDVGNSSEACVNDWKANDARKADRQLGIIVAKINAQLQQHEVDTYTKLKKQAKEVLLKSTTNSTTNSTDNSTVTSATDEDPEPFDVLDEPPAEANLTESETADWKANAAKMKERRNKGKPNPKGKPNADGFTQQLQYVCHTVDDRTVTLYMKMAECTTSDPCDDFDDVE